jgi:hypothetical protein
MYSNNIEIQVKIGFYSWCSSLINGKILLAMDLVDLLFG